MGFRHLDRLTEPWDGKQPDESLTHYTRFSQFRDQKRGERSVSEVAERVGVQTRTIEREAKAHRWDERAAETDRKATARHDERIAARSERYAEQQLATGEEILLLCRKSVRAAIEQDEVLSPADVPKWTEAAIKLRQSAQHAPDHVRAIYRQAETSGPGGTTSAWEIDVPEFEGLSPAGKRDRVVEMVSSISRLSEYEQRETGQG